MAKTLADMTADERQSCVGMWCDYTDPRENTYLVIYRWDKDGMASVHNPAAHNESLNTYVMVKALAPRFDLLRAWNPDGTPPKGEWVDGHMWWNEPGDDSQTVDLIGAECLGTGEMQGMDKWPENVTPAVSDEDIQVRRFITEWEESK